VPPSYDQQRPVQESYSGQKTYATERPVDKGTTQQSPQVLVYVPGRSTEKKPQQETGLVHYQPNKNSDQERPPYRLLAQKPAESYVQNVRTYKPVLNSQSIPGYDPVYVPDEFYPDNFSGIPGRAGIDYPIFSYPPPTDFYCAEQQYPGYYADVEARCQVFHICQPDGRANAFICPNGTLFNQQFFVCDWWYNVNCKGSVAFYSLNALLYGGVYANTNAAYKTA